MGRGVAFTATEDDFLVKNAENKTAKELLEMHQQLRAELVWPERSLKSIARRVERLREESKLGIRTEETRRKSYYTRKNLRGE